MRAAYREHILKYRDNGFIPEGSDLEGHDKARDAKAYPLEKILDVADAAITRDICRVPEFSKWMSDENECIRYWAVMGCVMLRRTADAAVDVPGALSKRLTDTSPSVRVAAAEALCHIGKADQGLPVLQECLSNAANPWVRLQAANALQNLGPKAKPALRAIEKATSDTNDYVKRATTYTAAVLKGQPTEREEQ
jgi:predicted Zn-dependent protease